MIFILSGHTHDHDDEPHITEDVFSCLGDHELHFNSLLKFMLNKTLEIFASLGPPREIIDRLHYVMYRIGKKENGLQIFYQCLKETQDRAPSHRDAVEILNKEGEFKA